MAAPDLTSTFLSNAFGGIKPVQAPNYSSVFGGGSKGMVIDPLTAVLGVGSIASSIFGGISGQQAQNAAIEAQVAGANFAAQQQADARAAQMAQGLLGMQFGEFIAAPRELERQKEAQKFQFGELAGMQRAGREEDWRRAMAQATSGAGKEAMREANRARLKDALAQQMGAGRAMFGPIAPISVDQMFAG